MQIENPEALRTWLATSLEPICDADPAALAKYVMALMKKDKSESELRDFCVEQLDVFLQKETKGFVDLLFKTVKDKSYLPPPTSAPASTEKEEKKPVAAPLQSAVSENKTRVPAKVEEAPRVTIASAAPQSNHEAKSSPSSEAAASSKPSRARSPIRAPERSRSRERDDRSLRVPPPPARSGNHRRSRSPRERERDRDRHGGALKGPDSRRPPPRDRRRSRSRSPYERRRRSRSRSRGAGTDEKRKSSPTSTTGDAVKPDSVTSTTSPEAGAEKAKSTSAATSGNGASSGSDGSKKKRRCRDFDEKGYCMLGDHCPYDHGSDPVVVKDVHLPNMITVTGPPPLPGGLPNLSVPPPGYRPVPAPEYNPEAPGMSVPTPVPPPPFFAHPPPMIGGSIPFPPPTMPNRDVIMLTGEQQMAGGPRKRGPGGYDHGPPWKRGRIRDRVGPKNPENCVLEVRKVPQYLNNITKLNRHFGKFGNVTNIKVRFDDDPEAALIEYGSHKEAMCAYKSTQPILNNRFIKVFWHSGEPEPPGTGKSAVKERLGAEPVQSVFDDTSMIQPRMEPMEDAQGNKRAVLMNAKGTLTTNVYNPEAIRSATAAAGGGAHQEERERFDMERKELLRQGYEKELNKQRKLERIRDAMRQKLDLQKKAAELFEKQVAQQKTLLAQVDKCKDAKQRKQLIETIKALEKGIEQSRQHLAKVGAPKSKEQLQNEIDRLKAEIQEKEDLGDDSKDLKKTLAQLELSVMSLKPLPLATSTPILAALSSKKRGNRPEYLSMDKRPRLLTVTGFDAADKDALYDHFQQYGEIDRWDIDDHQAVLEYKTRKEAEAAQALGATFKGTELTIEWPKTTIAVKPKANITAGELLASLSDQSGDESSDNEDDLLEEDDEDRGWKR